MPNDAPAPATEAKPHSRLRRFLPLVAIVILIGVVYAAGWHREISIESLVKHRAAIDAFVERHLLAAVAAYIGIYIAAVALSLPGASALTVGGGFVFGALVGGFAAVAGATIGATAIFLIARTALGETLLRRAGPRAAQLAEGFRADAFSYLLFLRLVPAFPFFLVNLVPALAGVRLLPFVAATALGIIPATFVFSYAGMGLGSIIAGQEAAYRACLAAGNRECHIAFDARDVLTPQLIGALVALAALALVPAVLKRVRVRREAAR
jgi:uncharacterized membrane protein YdjX (TVP38/TMEM64 family)